MYKHHLIIGDVVSKENEIYGRVLMKKTGSLAAAGYVFYEVSTKMMDVSVFVHTFFSIISKQIPYAFHVTTWVIMH